MKKYFRHKLENLIVVNKVVTIHYFEFDKNFRAEEESHDFWELVYADRESILCTADRTEIPLLEGEMLFHKPNEAHTLRANGQRAPNVFIISFECKSEAMRFFENRKIRPDENCVGLIYHIIEEAKKTFDIPYSDPGLQKLVLLSAPTLGGQQLIRNYLELLLINLMRALTETERGNAIFLPKEELDNKLVKDVLEVLRERVCGTVTVEEICERTSYSRAYIFREFKAVTGQSVMAYYSALKIEKAKQMLREGACTSRQISEALCFDSPNYFAKVFKRQTGLTPGAYRRRVFTATGPKITDQQKREDTRK